MFDSPLIWILILIGLAGVFSLGVFLGAYVAERDAQKKVEDVLKNYYPIGRKPEVLGLKWKIRDALGIEQPKHDRLPHW